VIDQAPSLVLASSSAVRARLLRDAGVAFEVEPARIDEEEVKHSLRGENADADAVADTLAELKARHVSRTRPGALVIGADQALVCQGTLFDKAPDLDHARAHLVALRGRTHELVAAVCVVRDGTRIWNHIGRARLTMRTFSDTFLDSYLAAVGEEALASVGCYQLEGRGAQLFARTEGDYFTILGLPILPLLDFLRSHGAVPR
jgi:septum formation protein